MPINFPSSPSNNQVYTYSDRSWVWANNYGVWLANTSGTNVTANVTTQIFTANGTSALFTLNEYINFQNNVIVTVDGVVAVPQNEYQIVGTALTFNVAPIANTTIEARSFEKGFKVVGYTGSQGVQGYYSNGQSIAVNDLYANGTAYFTGNTGGISAIFRNMAEYVNVVASGATGTINFDITDESVLYYTSNATANFTLNFRGNASLTMNTLLANGQSTTVVFMNTNGATGYYCNNVQIDGSTITPKWAAGYAPSTGYVSSVDTYSFTIIKTNNSTYTVLASQSQYA